MRRTRRNMAATRDCSCDARRSEAVLADTSEPERDAAGDAPEVELRDRQIIEAAEVGQVAECEVPKRAEVADVAAEPPCVRREHDDAAAEIHPELAATQFQR